MDSGRKPDGDYGFEQKSVETDIPCFQQIHFSWLHQGAHYKDGTYGLGDQRGDGSSLNPQIQSHYQQDIQKYIDKAAHDQIVQGTFGIPTRLSGSQTPTL
mgnify:CR=1 FL=1